MRNAEENENNRESWREEKIRKCKRAPNLEQSKGKQNNSKSTDLDWLLRLAVYLFVCNKIRYMYILKDIPRSVAANPARLDNKDYPVNFRNAVSKLDTIIYYRTHCLSLLA